MTKRIRILLQTTIPATEDDWSIERFSLLGNHLALIRNNSGTPYEVTPLGIEELTVTRLRPSEVTVSSSLKLPGSDVHH